VFEYIRSRRRSAALLLEAKNLRPRRAGDM
jgi:hypothetical protein